MPVKEDPSQDPHYSIKKSIDVVRNLVLGSFFLIFLSIVLVSIVLYNQSENNKTNSAMMNACREYVYQIIDICTNELDEGETSDRQKEFLQKIVNRFQDIKYIKKSKHNAYTLNKSVIYFHPTNVMNINHFVLIHELAHIGTDVYGDESPIFWENNKYLLKLAESYGAYTPINYEQGVYIFHNLSLDENPLFLKSIIDIDTNGPPTPTQKNSSLNPPNSLDSLNSLNSLNSLDSKKIKGSIESFSKFPLKKDHKSMKENFYNYTNSLKLSKEHTYMNKGHNDFLTEIRAPTNTSVPPEVLDPTGYAHNEAQKKHYTNYVSNQFADSPSYKGGSSKTQYFKDFLVNGTYPDTETAEAIYGQRQYMNRNPNYYVPPYDPSYFQEQDKEARDTHVMNDGIFRSPHTHTNGLMDLNVNTGKKLHFGVSGEVIQHLSRQNDYHFKPAVEHPFGDSPSPLSSPSSKKRLENLKNQLYGEPIRKEYYDDMSIMANLQYPTYFPYNIAQSRVSDSVL